MENDKKRSREPFPSGNTPEPPQVMDPRNPPVRDDEKTDDSNSTVPEGDSEKRPSKEKTGKK